MPSPATPNLSDEQLGEVLALLKDADSVELKLTVPDSDQWSAAAVLGLDPLEAEIRQVFFFDTPDLALDRRGIVVRARRGQRKGDDSTVKLRPVVPSELPDSLRADPDVVVEVDALPGGFVCSASYKHALAKPVVRPTLLGGKPLRKLFSKGQRAFLADHAPDGPALEDLAVLGPLLVLKLRARPEGLNRKMVAELWLFPDGSRILELSTKGTPDEALEIAGEARVFLSERGIDLEGEQATKTRKALEFFAGTLTEHDGSITGSGGRGAALGQPAGLDPLLEDLAVDPVDRPLGDHGDDVVDDDGDEHGEVEDRAVVRRGPGEDAPERLEGPVRAPVDPLGEVGVGAGVEQQEEERQREHDDLQQQVGVDQPRQDPGQA